MLGFLFRGLTAEPARGAALFDALINEARRSHWYVEGQVPDTVDGRFAVLATLVALAIVRLEQFAESGDAVTVALTERFIEVMESEHRELGLGDPALGRTVRKLVSILGKRTQLWRHASQDGWYEATRESLYKSDPSAAALRHSAQALNRFAKRLAEIEFAQLEQGRIE